MRIGWCRRRFWRGSYVVWPLLPSTLEEWDETSEDIQFLTGWQHDTKTGVGFASFDKDVIVSRSCSDWQDNLRWECLIMIIIIEMTSENVSSTSAKNLGKSEEPLNHPSVHGGFKPGKMLWRGSHNSRGYDNEKQKVRWSVKNFYRSHFQYPTTFKGGVKTGLEWSHRKCYFNMTKLKVTHKQQKRRRVRWWESTALTWSLLSKREDARVAQIKSPHPLPKLGINRTAVKSHWPHRRTSWMKRQQLASTGRSNQQTNRLACVDKKNCT